MKLQMTVADEKVCVIEVWDDKVPNLCNVLREKLPMKSILQHGKLIGDMVFFTMPIVAPWENKYKTEDVGETAPRAVWQGDRRGLLLQPSSAVLCGVWR